MSESRPPRRSPPQRAIAAAAKSEIVGQAAALWGTATSDPRPIPPVQNFVFEIERVRSPAILRLTHESHRSVEEVEAELRWLLALKERALPVAGPFLSSHERLTETVESSHGRFVAACFEFLPGEAAESESWDDGMFEQLGALTASLHQDCYDAAWTQAKLPRRTWREESVAQNFHFYVPIGEQRVHEAFDRVLAVLDALPRSRDSYGLIHADLNDANFFHNPQGLNVFDFDDSCYCWFVYDLLVPIFHLPVADQAVMNARAEQAFRHLLRGYESVRRFNPLWLKWIPLFLQWRDLQTYGFFYEQLEIPALPEDLRRTFLAMRARIEAGRPIAEIGGAG
ncbi:phosphotransferase enzyme family protein [soil metagenome]